VIVDTKLCCPKCGCTSSMKSFARDEVLELMQMAAKFGGRWSWVAEYLHGFQTDHDKPLRPSTLKILVGEIREMIDKGGFLYDRQQHAVRPEAVYQGLKQVALKNMVGLKNHNYLKKVVMDINLKLIQGEEREQKVKEQEALQRDPDAPQRLQGLLNTLGKIKERD